MLWADKHRPVSLDKLQLHGDVNNRLSRLLSNAIDFPHLLLYGPPGSGKGVRVHCILRHLFGPAVDRRKVSHKTFKSGSKTIELSLIGSMYHIELNPSEVGPFNDRMVVQEVIKEIASTSNVSSMTGAAENASASQSKESTTSPAAYKIVVLSEVDHLSLQAQQALRRTMEQYTQTCRLILVASSLTKVIGPLRSRCLGVRVSAPTVTESRMLLRRIADREQLQVSDAMLDRIGEASEFNLRRAILCLEAARVRHAAMSASSASTSSGSQQIILSDAMPLPQPDWADQIDFIARQVCEEQSGHRLLLVRQRLYELLSNCIPPTVILRSLTIALLRRCDDTIKTQIIEFSAEFDHRMAQGSKHIFHLEAFIAKFMATYKQWVLTTFG